MGQRRPVTVITPEQMLDCVRPGDTVVFLLPNGLGRYGRDSKRAGGRAMICSPGHVTVNMGGPHGMPAVVTAANILEVKPARR